MDMQKIETFYQQLGTALSKHDFGETRRLTEDYLASENFHSHVGLGIAGDFVLHPELLDLAEKVITKSIRENTVENLARLLPQMGNERHQKVEFGRLYSLYAWILWKQHNHREALTVIGKAMAYIDQTGGPTADDRMRLGIIKYGNESEAQGWENISQALLMDSQIERRDPGYMRAIAKIIHEMYGEQTDSEGFLAEYRHQHAEKVPDSVFITLEGERIRLDRQHGKVLFVNFFSPLCGSCRQEIPSLKAWYDSLRTHTDLAIFFVLNQPQMKQKAATMFEEAGISNPTILTVENGSAYDLISAEPSVWIVDAEGRIVSKHTGYERGDESVYRQKLSELLQQ